MREDVRVYILGLKSRGDGNYGLTTWIGDDPIVYAVYDENPGYWHQSTKIVPKHFVESEKEAEKLMDWSYIGFGWKVNKEIKDTPNE